MAPRLQDKVILVVGAGGIGDALVRRYAEEGASVIAADINGDVARNAAAQVTDSGGSAVGLEVDGTDEAAIAEAVARARQEFGGLDGLHVNFTHVHPLDHSEDILGLPLEVYDAALSGETRGYMLCTRLALPSLIERGAGSIIYTSSDAAYIGEPTRFAYAMAKSAIHALMRHVATRFGPQGIRANVVAPGTIVHNPALFPEAIIQQATALNRIKTRLGTPEDIAGLSALLMSEEGGYITGQVMNVNGGYTIRA